MTKRDEKPAGVRPQLQTSFVRSADRRFSGYAVDPDELSRAFTVDLLIDGSVIKSTTANEYADELAAKAIGDGCYGFSFHVPESILRDGSWIEARLSNLDVRLGEPIEIGRGRLEVRDVKRPARLRWTGGLRLEGWLDDADEVAPVIDVIVDGEVVSTVKASGWAHVFEGEGEGRAVRAFSFLLPGRFADGSVHRVSIAQATGELLARALPVVAFADGLAEMIQEMADLDSERPRAELFDRLLPMSMPFASYEDWRQRFGPEAAAPSDEKIAVVLIGDGDVDRTLDSLDRQSHADWIAASLILEHEPVSFEPAELRSFLERDGAECSLVIFALAGSVFDPHALAHMASAFERPESAELAYCDVDLIGKDGARWPLALPAFDYERLLEQGYCAHLFAMRRQSLMNGLSRGASSLYRVFNSVLEEDGRDPAQVLHIPLALAAMPAIELSAATEALVAASAAHLSARGVEAEIEAGEGTILPAARVSRLPAAAEITVVIPTRNKISVLRKCLESIRPGIERVSAQVLVIDNGSNDPETIDFLARLDGDDTRVVRIDEPFNFGRLNNLASAQIDSQYLCLLNDDIEALDDQWLEEMLGRIAEPDVGAVGALLLWPSGVVQHGGFVLGPNFRAEHAFNDRIDADPGYGDLLRVARECSAVSAACMVTRRSDYLRVGGLDETSLSIAFNDVDYCLKLRALGRRIVFTPHARLLHAEAVSRGESDRPDIRNRYERELRTFRARWAEAIMDDPCYNPNLSRDMPYSALSWPPGVRDVRVPALPACKDFPPGF